MAEWFIANGHILGQCAYLRSLEDLTDDEEECDCRELRDDEAAEDFEDDDYSGDLAYEGSW